MNGNSLKRRRLSAILSVFVGVCFLVPLVESQQLTNVDQNQLQSGTELAESELQVGTRLTRAGRFLEAIPHLLVARDGVSTPYAAEFNLALCYVATHQGAHAIPILTNLRRTHKDAQVENLLTQAY